MPMQVDFVLGIGGFDLQAVEKQLNVTLGVHDHSHDHHHHDHEHEHGHDCSGANCSHESHAHSHDHGHSHEHKHEHAHAEGGHSHSHSHDHHDCGDANCTHESHSHAAPKLHEDKVSCVSIVLEGDMDLDKVRGGREGAGSWELSPEQVAVRQSSESSTWESSCMGSTGCASAAGREWNAPGSGGKVKQCCQSLWHKILLGMRVSGSYVARSCLLALWYLQVNYSLGFLLESHSEHLPHEGHPVHRRLSPGAAEESAWLQVGYDLWVVC